MRWKVGRVTPCALFGIVAKAAGRGLTRTADQRHHISPQDSEIAALECLVEDYVVGH